MLQGITTQDGQKARLNAKDTVQAKAALRKAGLLPRGRMDGKAGSLRVAQAEQFIVSSDGLGGVNVRSKGDAEGWVSRNTAVAQAFLADGYTVAEAITFAQGRFYSLGQLQARKEA
jgi:hypothetical protein